MNTDVEDLLREGMERFTADLRAPAGLTRLAARRRRRRLALRSATGLVSALAAGAVALAMVVVPSREGIDTAAYVVKRVGSALSAADPAEIAQMKVTTSGPAKPGGETVTTTAEEWSYGNQWRAITYSTAGHPVYDEGSSATSVYTLVSYKTQTWARQSGVGSPAPLAVGPPGKAQPIPAFPVLFRFGLPGTSSAASSLPATVARALHAAVSGGVLTVAGRERVDGVEAIKLTSRPGSRIAETIWVNQGTYLPVRVVVSVPFFSAVKQTADITWLPRTAQNLAKLTVPIPAGFRHVSLFDALTPNLQQLIPGVQFAAPVAGFPARFGRSLPFLSLLFSCGPGGVRGGGKDC